MFGPIIAKPGTSRKNKTGSWRTGAKPKFLQKDCIACRLCLILCPEGCIEGTQKNSFHCDYDYCKGCGICAFICPKRDIEMISEEK